MSDGDCTTGAREGEWRRLGAPETAKARPDKGRAWMNPLGRAEAV
jgi:hypothetical protein